MFEGRSRLEIRGRIILVSIGALALASSTIRADTPTTDGPALKWEKLGASTGRPLIFLPAVGFPGHYWSKVYDEFKATHPIYVITYAGSGGVRAISAPYLEKIVDGLHDLITQEKLKSPALVGHFMGLQLSIRLAAKYPDDVGGIFGLPLMTAPPPVEVRKEAGERLTAEYLGIEPDLWLPTLSQQVRGVVRDPATVDHLMSMFKDTDRETYARMIGELTADSIEEYLPKIRCPVCLIATVPLQQRRETLEEGQERLAALSQARVEQIRMLYPGLAKCYITALRNVQFYAMMDSANRLVFPLQRFLQRLDDPKSRWESTITTTTSPDATSPAATNP